MSSIENLKQSVLNVVQEFDLIAPHYQNLPSEYPNELKLFANRVLECANKIRDLPSLIDIKEKQIIILKKLVTDKSSEEVLYLNSKVNFNHARLLGFSSLFSICWAISDVITDAFGNLTSSHSVVKNPINNPKLWPDFIQGGSKQDRVTTPFHGSETLLRLYGFPVGLMYSLRNIFVHQGGLINGRSIFEGISIHDGYMISVVGFENLESDIEAKKINFENYSKFASFQLRNDNLLEIVEKCSVEMDKALEFIIRWVGKTIKEQIAIILDQQ